MLFNDVLYHRQPQSRTVRFGRVVRGKNGGQLFWRNPFPTVYNGDFNAIGSACACLNTNGPLIPDGMNCIQIKIQQYLRQPVRIGLNER